MLDKASQHRMTLQSMVFEPKTRMLYLAAGINATQLPYDKLDLVAKFAEH